MILCPLPHDEPAEAWNGPLCKTHRRQLIRDIRNLPGYYDDLELQLHPAGPALKPFTTGTGEEPPFVNGAVADFRWLIRRELRLLTGCVVDERNLEPYTGSDDPGALVAWLDRHLDWLSRQWFAPAEAEKFRALASEARAKAYPRAVRKITCARCVEVVFCDVPTRTERRCNGDLIVTLRLDEEEQGLDPAGIVCSVCGVETPRRYWLALGQKIRRAS